MSIENRLPIPLTADGVPVGIGDTVYAIWNEVRRNTRGKFYRASTIAVYPVKVTSVLFTESFVEHRVMWSGDGYANIPVCCTGRLADWRYLLQGYAPYAFLPLQRAPAEEPRLRVRLRG